VTDAPGSYSTGATFAGNSGFLTSTAPVVGFTVNQQPTELVSIPPTGAAYHDTVVVSAQLLEQHTSNPVDLTPAPRHVTLTLGTQTCTANADSTGTASCPITITQAPGPVNLTASFGGDAWYVAAPDPTPTAFTISPAPTTVTYTGVHAADYSDPAALSATLVETDTGNAVDATPPPRSIKFNLGNQTCSSPVSGKNAACTLILNQPSGGTTITASFAGDAFYAASTGTDPFTITQEENSLSYTGPTSAKKGSKVTLTAKLTHGSTPLTNRKLVFQLGTQTCTPAAPTNAYGIASCTLTLTQAPGTGYTVTVTFAGDAYYQSNSASKAFTIKS
jgi:hypothetical protein